MSSAREPAPWKDAVRIVHEPNGGWHIEVDREKMRLLDEHLLAPTSPARMRAMERIEQLPRNAPGTTRDHVYLHHAASMRMLAWKRRGRIVLPGATERDLAHPGRVKDSPELPLPPDPPVLRDGCRCSRRVGWRKARVSS